MNEHRNEFCRINPKDTEADLNVIGRIILNWVP
jgi:hypothetical protein